MKYSDYLIVKFVQKYSYSEELDMLERSGRVKASSPLAPLSPTLKDGINVVGGRLSQAPISRGSKSPKNFPTRAESVP